MRRPMQHLNILIIMLLRILSIYNGTLYSNSKPGPKNSFHITGEIGGAEGILPESERESNSSNVYKLQDAKHLPCVPGS